MVLVNILLMSAKLQILMLCKPAGFWKILRDIMISRHEFIVKNIIYNFLCDVEDLQVFDVKLQFERSRLGLESKICLNMPYR